MAVRGIAGSGHQVYAARAAYEVAALSNKSVSRPPSKLIADSTATSVKISDRAELFAKLRLLHDSQPKEFKRQISEMAETVRAAADAASGDKRALTSVAERFAQAASEGNLTPLVPAIESARVSRNAFAGTADPMQSDSDAMRALFRGFVTKVNAVLNSAASGQAAAKR